MSETQSTDMPGWVDLVDDAPSFKLDADQLLRSDSHPLAVVQEHASALVPLSGGWLRASFNPSPLIDAMRKQGYEIWLSTDDRTGHVLVRIWKGESHITAEPEPASQSDEGRFWFAEDGLHLDVRHLPPPEPMIAIIQYLDSNSDLAEGILIHTPHFPIHLIPELEERTVRWEVVSDEPGDSILRLSRD